MTFTLTPIVPNSNNPMGTTGFYAFLKICDFHPYPSRRLKPDILHIMKISHSKLRNVIFVKLLVQVLVLAWSYSGLDPFLAKTGPGKDTIIKQTTTRSPHTNFSKAIYISVIFGQTWARSRHYNQTDHQPTTPPTTPHKLF